MNRPLRVLSVVVSVCLALVLVLPWLDTEHLLPAYLPAAQATWVPVAFVSILAAITLVVLALRNRDRLAAALAVVLVALVVAVPWTVAPDDAPDCGPQQTHQLRVLSINTYMSTATNVADLVRQIEPDVLVLPEADGAFVARLQKQLGHERFAHAYASPKPWNYATSLLSRVPMSGHEQLPATTLQTYAVRLQVPGGPVTLLAAHPFPPLPHQIGQWHDALDALRRWAQAQPKDARVVMAGDFNSAWVHPQLRHATAGYDDMAASLDGLQPTWPSWPLGTGLSQIDHVYARGMCRLDSRVVGVHHSDHRGVWATLRW